MVDVLMLALCLLACNISLTVIALLFIVRAHLHGQLGNGVANKEE